MDSAKEVYNIALQSEQPNQHRLKRRVRARVTVVQVGPNAPVLSLASDKSTFTKVSVCLTERGQLSRLREIHSLRRTIFCCNFFI